MTETASDPRQPSRLEKKKNMPDRGTRRGRGRRPGPACLGRPAQALLRWSSLRPMTIRWISEVPSPISSSGASR
ncbi:MAG: hypothetical protein QOD44_2523 [Solirubrobacteraceae bacterium]|nr:hypothetical protein [Solirubrobacteraceae bacterium]